MMKRFISLGILFCMSVMSIFAQNRERSADRIWLDSKDGHNGTAVWKMQSLDKISDPAETISMVGYDMGGWLPAIVPGTVLNTDVYNGKFLL